MIRQRSEAPSNSFVVGMGQSANFSSHAMVPTSYVTNYSYPNSYGATSNYGAASYYSAMPPNYQYSALSRNTHTHTHKNTNTQTHKHTNTQTHKHTNTLIVAWELAIVLLEYICMCVAMKRTGDDNEGKQSDKRPCLRQVSSHTTRFHTLLTQYPNTYTHIPLRERKVKQDWWHCPPHWRDCC